MNRTSQLATLFLDLFNPMELQMFLSGLGGHYDEVISAVAWRDAPKMVTYHVAEALGRRGLIGDVLFDALVAERPGRRAEIDRLRAPGAGPATAPSQAGAGTNISTTPPASLPAVYLSYKWGADDALVDEIEAAIRAANLDVRRDNIELSYKDSIGEYVDQLGAGAAVVAIIGKGYLESPWCMRELLTIHEQRNFRARLFPVRLGDLPKIDNPIVRLEYRDHWAEQLKKLEETVKRGEVAGISEQTRAYLAMVRGFAGRTDELLAEAADMLTPSVQVMRAEDFATLRTKLKAWLTNVAGGGH